MPQTNARVRVAPHTKASMLTFIIALILRALALANPQFAYADGKGNVQSLAHFDSSTV